MRSDTWKPILQLDMRRALRAARGEVLRLRDDEGYSHVRTWKEFKKAVTGMGPSVSVDIETGGPADDTHRVAITPLLAWMLCIGISDGETTVVIDPRRGQGEKPVWGPRLVAAMQKFLEGRSAVTMHNGYNFDQIVMMKHGFKFAFTCNGAQVTLLRIT